ncbi:ionotropic receptor 75a-like [Lasioglossum baleicum]|uniref:ionotropic receptor 75a-like n=1 Tax=Lasioglossum baleicum TaxID=434251 RepID=UPI003FCCC79B
MNPVNIFVFLLPQLTGVLCVDENEIIRDYFSFKKVSRVVGFSCETLESEYEIRILYLKMLSNNFSFKVVIANANSTFEKGSKRNRNVGKEQKFFAKLLYLLIDRNGSVESIFKLDINKKNFVSLFFYCADVLILYDADDVMLARTFNDMYITYISLMRSRNAQRIDVRKLLRAEYHQLGVFLDSRCNSKRYNKILLDATKYSMYGEMHKWLIFGTNLTHSLEMLNDNTFSILTDIVIVVPTTKDYVLYDVYNPCKERGGSMNVTNFGTWNSKKGLDVTLTQSKFDRRSNLHGMTLRVGIVMNFKPENQSLHEMMLEYSMKAKYGRSKFLYVLLWHLSSLYNFTMNVIQITAQRRFDHSGPVFEAFKKKTIDLSTSPVAMKVDRLNNGDIIGPVWPIRSCFMFRTISSTKIKPAQFLKPLSVKVWYGVLSMIVIVMSILIIFIRLEGVREPADNYGLSVLLTIGALSQQGSAFVPTRCAARIAFLQILLFSTIILNYYSASVVSNRLKNKGEKMNDSLISLAKSGMKLAVEPTPYVRSFLQVPDADVRYFYQNCWSKIPEYNRYLPLEEGLDGVAKGTLAYHAMVDSAYPYIEHTFNDRSICELTEVHLLNTNLAFYARHRSPFTKLLKIGLTKIRNVGIQKRELKRWSARQPFCPSNLLIAEPLSIHEAAPVFVFLCIAVGFAILICVIENLVYCCLHSRFLGAMIEGRHLIDKNLYIPSLRDINMQTLRNFNLFRDSTSSQIS